MIDPRYSVTGANYPLTDKQRELIALVDEIGPGMAARAERYDRAASFPFENYADMRKAGLLGLCVPEKFGGRGADSLNSTVSLSRTLIDSTALNRELRGMLMPVGGFTMRSKVALISSAVMSAPSWKVTPSRRKNV